MLAKHAFGEDWTSFRQWVIPCLRCATVILGLSLGLPMGRSPCLFGAETKYAVAEQSIRSVFRQLAVRADQNKASVIEGDSGWLYLASDVRFLSHATYWGAAAVDVSRAKKREWADPQPAIQDFQKQLRSAGITLVIVPVPPKPAWQGGTDFVTAADPEIGSQRPSTESRLDSQLARFLEVLGDDDVVTVDLGTAFSASQAESKEPLYCKTDSHWSGHGIRITAQEVARVIRGKRLLTHADTKEGISNEKPRYSESKGTVQLHGDLVDLARMRHSGKNTDAVETPMAQPKPGPTETIPLWNVTETETGKPPKTDVNSTVLVLGDSHTLFLHDPGFHTTGAGFPDHLARELNQPVDVLGVRGSGGTSARITIARQKSRLANKRIVIWCFAAREFSESTDGWRLLNMQLPSRS